MSKEKKPELQKDEHGCVVGKEVWNGKKCVPSPPKTAEVELREMINGKRRWNETVWKEAVKAYKLRQKIQQFLAEKRLREGRSEKREIKGQIVPIAGMVIRTKPLKEKPAPVKTLPPASTYNAPNIVAGETLYRPDGSTLSKVTINEMRKKRGREPI